MTRQIIATRDFEKKLAVFIQRHRSLKNKTQKVISLLKRDVYSATLYTHKLSGKLKNLYACSIDYNYRLVFTFDSGNIYLLNLGSHDEVY